MRTALFILMCLTAFQIHSQSFSSLEERMSATEFRKAGLDKLSPEELAALNAWVRGNLHSGPEVAPSPEDDRLGFPVQERNRRTIVSRIDGELDGWGGDPLRKTRFRLQNGQVWEQVDTSVGSIRAVDPVVTISPAALNSWIMKIEESNRPIRVRRIE